MSPCVIAAAKAQVPAMIRSGSVACVAGFNFVTPSIVIVVVPRPEIFAPISIKKLPISTISGSRAALSITVVPLASTAAIMMFSVAPTDGKSNSILVPVRPFRTSVTM